MREAFLAAYPRTVIRGRIEARRTVRSGPRTPTYPRTVIRGRIEAILAPLDTLFAPQPIHGL